MARNEPCSKCGESVSMHPPARARHLKKYAGTAAAGADVKVSGSGIRAAVESMKAEIANVEAVAAARVAELQKAIESLEKLAGD